MASLDLATLSVKITADAKEAVKGIQEVGKESEKQKKKIEINWKKTGETLTKYGKKLSLVFSVPITALGTACVKLASDLTETLGKTEVVFGDLTSDVVSWSETSIENMGLAQETALSMASTYGDLGTSMGFTNSEAADMSMNLVQLAADMASFKNISIERANTALTAVYTGETESLKAMGIVMTEANLETFAMNEGLQTTYKDMSQTEKVMLRYKYVMNQTKNAQGDFVRTGGSLANQSRKLGENIKELGTSFGKILEPAITGVISVINDIVSWLNSLGDGAKRVILTVAEILAIIPLVVTAVGTIINIIDVLKVAMAALAANPVAAIFTAVIAVAVTAAVVIGNVKASIDEYNKSVAEMKDKYTTVESKYYTFVSVIEDEDQNIDSVIEGIRAAIDLVNSTREFAATLYAIEDKDFNVSNFISSIDDLLKTQEFICNIEGRKPQDDQVWKELNLLKDEAIDGKFVVSAEDRGLMVARLESQTYFLLNNLHQLEKYNTKVIKPMIQVATETPQEKADKLYSKLAEIAGVDTNVDYAFTINGLDGDNGVLGVLSNAIVSAGEWSTKLDEIKASFDDLIQQQKSYIESIAQQQIEAAFQAHENGLITFEELVTTIQAATTQSQNMCDAIDKTSESYTMLMEGMASGNLEEAVSNVSKLREEAKTLNPELGNTGTAEETVATNLGQMIEAIDSGQTNVEAMCGQIANATQGYTAMADTIENGVIDAYTKYGEAVDKAKQQQTETTDGLKEEKTKLEEVINALRMYDSCVKEMGDNSAMGLGALRRESQSAYNSVIEFYGGYDEAMIAGTSTLSNDIEKIYSELKYLQDTYNESVKTAENEKNNAVRSALQQLGQDLTNLQTSYNTEDLLRQRQFFEEQGKDQAVSEIDRLLSLTNYLNLAAVQTEEGLFSIGSLHRDCINSIGALSVDGKIAGLEVGNGLGEGIYDGLSKWTNAIINKAEEIVGSAVSGARKEADINSPSKKMRDLVGKPLGEGLEVGIDDSIGGVLRSVKNGVKNIFTVGTQSIPRTNSGVNNTINNNGRNCNTTIQQTNNFNSKTLSPFEQQQQIHRLNKDLLGVFA